MFAFAASILCFAIQLEPSPSPFSHLNMPVHGTLYKQGLFGFFADQKSDAAIYAPPRPLPLVAIPIDNPAKKSWRRINMGIIGGSLSFRHHVRDETIWFSLGPRNIIRIPFDDLQLVDPANKKREEQFKKKHPTPGASYGDAFGLNSPALWDKYSRIRSKDNGSGGFSGGGSDAPAKGVAGIDFAPTSPTTNKVFYFPKKNKKIEAWETEAQFDEKKQQWNILADLRNFETIDSLFVEDYYAFIRTNNYYFVTESGKLYFAPPPKAGEKSRTMKELWVDAKRPIVAVIEDADNDKVWLFAKDKNTGAKRDLYFEMKDTIQAESFDPTKLRPVNVEGRAKMLLEFLPLIRAGAK